MLRRTSLALLLASMLGGCSSNSDESSSGDSSPQLVAEGVHFSLYALAGESVFWVTCSDTCELKVTPKAGGVTKTLDSEPEIVAVTGDATSAYYLVSKPTTTEVRMVPITGGSPVIAATVDGHPSHLAVTGAYVYADEWRIPKAGGTAEQQPSMCSVWALVADGAAAYAIAGTTDASGCEVNHSVFALGAAAPTLLAEFAQSDLLALNAGYVYGAAYDGVTLLRAPRAGGGAEHLPVTKLQGVPVGLAADEKWVYFANATLDDPTIARVSAAQGGAMKALVHAPVHDVSVDETHVYYLGEYLGPKQHSWTLFRIPKS